MSREVGKKFNWAANSAGICRGGLAIRSTQDGGEPTSRVAEMKVQQEDNLASTKEDGNLLGGRVGEYDEAGQLTMGRQTSRGR